MQQAIVTGKVCRNPEVKIAKTGKEYGTIILQANDKGSSVFWRIMAFSENLVSELKLIKNGDPLLIQGALELSVYEKDGKWQIRRSIVASQVASMRKVSRN